MAYFCTATGVRVVAPGLSKSAGGTIPEYDGTPAHVAAENAAAKALEAGRMSQEELAPTQVAIAAAAKAALATLVPPEPPVVVKSEPDPKAKAPTKATT